MKETFFSPWSLARVCKAVEWEEELVRARDGSSNQGKYMEAIGTLWERWVRGWSLPDVLAAAHAAGTGEWTEAFFKLFETLENRVVQIIGWYSGIWAGANPRGLPGWVWPPIPEQPGAPPLSIVEQRVSTFIETLMTYLRFYFEEEQKHERRYDRP